MAELITGVAVLTENGELWSLPKPHRHHHIFALAALTGHSADPGKQGFVTNLARFVDRKEALSIAGQTGQLREFKNGDPAELYSEDLW